MLGKLIGVYLGRPFEGWTHQRIMAELGPIEYYVNDRLNQPLVVTDDDVAGTFTFIRALEDYGISPDLDAESIGKAWLNYICEERSILWWGGNGNSTEHTAWLNPKRGIPAPASGSMETNGTIVAEQIGAQIFIDGWALVAPCQPRLAAKLAEQAGKVSHDGESVHAAMLWAAMEAEAFRTCDVDALLDAGLSVIPADCLIARLIADVRRWHAASPDWRDCRQRIEETYGYDRYLGIRHVVPNHALMIMAILYAPDDFQRAQMIVNTSGWDTDCNAGNVGCLMHHARPRRARRRPGLARPDRRPAADLSADGGNSINDAVRVAYYLSAIGRQLAREPIPTPPKSGAQFHFSLPGSRQGFRLRPEQAPSEGHRLRNVAFEETRALSIGYEALGPGQRLAAVTPTFTPPEVLQMRTYALMASPLLYPGQTILARVVAPATNVGTVRVALRLRVYGDGDGLRDIDGDAVELAPGEDQVLSWTLPAVGGQPVARSASSSRPREAGQTAKSSWTICAGTARAVVTLRRRRATASSGIWPGSTASMSSLRIFLRASVFRRHTAKA